MFHMTTKCHLMDTGWSALQHTYTTPTMCAHVHANYARRGTGEPIAVKSTHSTRTG